MTFSPFLSYKAIIRSFSKKALRCGEDLLSARNPFSLHIQTVAQTGGVHSSDGSAKPQGCQSSHQKYHIFNYAPICSNSSRSLFPLRDSTAAAAVREILWEPQCAEVCSFDSTEPESINIKPPGSFSPAEVTDSFNFLQVRHPREERHSGSLVDRKHD